MARVLSELKPDYLVLRSFEIDENQHFYGGAFFENEAQRRAFRSHYVEMQRFASAYDYGPLSRLTVYRRLPGD